MGKNTAVIELHPEDLQKFNITDTAINQLEKMYMPLVIEDINDAEAF